MSLIEAYAPSNIALIKYMGKLPDTGNVPTNASLSYSLDYLQTCVRLTPAAQDDWQPMEKPSFASPELSAKGREKFLKHFDLCRREMGGAANFTIQSANNFPSDCGLASSSSSFAALTKAAAQAFSTKFSEIELSKISRKGSGSSCRSWFTPWALWRDEGAEPIELGFNDLIHAVVVVHAGIKEVSSSEAHVRVTTSSKFKGRPERANARLEVLIGALRAGDWKQSFEICWDEFHDMHELFETSEKPFRYRTANSQAVVDACKHIWNFKGDGPIVTMDAGPNVHLLFRPDQTEIAQKMITHFKQKHIVLFNGVTL